jgi:hypothetical protein
VHWYVTFFSPNAPAAAPKGSNKNAPRIAFHTLKPPVLSPIGLILLYLERLGHIFGGSFVIFSSQTNIMNFFCNFILSVYEINLEKNIISILKGKDGL